jgi:hypothetical protein
MIGHHNSDIELHLRAMVVQAVFQREITRLGRQFPPEIRVRIFLCEAGCDGSHTYGFSFLFIKTPQPRAAVPQDSS